MIFFRWSVCRGSGRYGWDCAGGGMVLRLLAYPCVVGSGKYALVRGKACYV